MFLDRHCRDHVLLMTCSFDARGVDTLGWHEKARAAINQRSRSADPFG
jgi:hypothetical protein